MKRAISWATIGLSLLTTPALAQARQNPQNPPGTVALPLADYDRLLDRASRPPKKAEAPPVDAIVSRADMKLRVADEYVRGTFKLEGEVFKKGPARVPLIDGATLIEATLKDATPPLAIENGRHSAILIGPSTFEIDLAWSGPVMAEPGRAYVIIPVPIAGSLGLTLDLPGEVSDVRIDPGLVTKMTTSGGRTVVEATPDRTSSLRVSWAARAAAVAPRESRFLSDLKTLLTVDEADLRMAVLVDLNVVQGQPDRFTVVVPGGWTLAGASGSTLDSFSLPNGTVVMNMREPERRTHQVLLSFERQVSGVTFPLDFGPVSVSGAQRETGEIGIEGLGTLELRADEKGAMKRMDARETNAALRALAREPLLAAFRYHARVGEAAAVAIDVKRFPETSALAAIADRAEATSLVTTEGRVLTEVKLLVKNHAQPFLRVALPQGATVLSAEVEGQSVKPAMGEGGTRIPLLRAGFRPTGPYSVSFVYLQTADAFAKRGDGRLSLPGLDVPVSLLAWEVFLPDLLQVREFGGNAAREGIWAETRAFGTAGRVEDGSVGGVKGGAAGGITSGLPANLGTGGAGELRGLVTDSSGGSLPGVRVTVGTDGFLRSTTTSNDGSYEFLDLPNRPLELNAYLAGFSPRRSKLSASSGARRLNLTLEVAAMREIVEVAAEASADSERASASRAVAASPNVANLQRRVAGVLPVRIEIPRAGHSYRFARPLVVDEETFLTFKYQTR